MRVNIFFKLTLVVWSVFISAGYIFLSEKLSFLNTSSLKVSDYFLRYRHNYFRPPELINKFVLVTVDERTINYFHQRWPLKRRIYSAMLDYMYGPEGKPAVCALDFSFSGKSEDPGDDILLADALKRAGNVIIIGYSLPQSGVILPDPEFAAAAWDIGYVNLPRDPDLIIRRNYVKAPGTESISAVSGYSLPFKMYSKLKGLDPHAVIALPEAVPKDVIRINYFADFNDFKTVPLEKIASGLEPAESFKDKIVLVGATSEVVHDIHPTPLGLMPGVFINANALLNILSGRFLLPLPWWISFLIYFFSVLIVGFSVYYLGNIKAISFIIILFEIGHYAVIQCIARDIIFDLFGFITLITLAFVVVAAYKYINMIIENARLKQEAVTDGLTGLYIFRYFELKLKFEMRNALKSKEALSLVIFDIDDFKKLNEVLGHEGGNSVLKQVSGIMKSNIRGFSGDTLCRFGGEEFVLILPKTVRGDAYKCAEKIRKAVAASTLTDAQLNPVSLTISAGVASFSSGMADIPNELVKIADKALYQAKAQGKNQVVIYKESLASV